MSICFDQLLIQLFLTSDIDLVLSPSRQALTFIRSSEHAPRSYLSYLDASDNAMYSDSMVKVVTQSCFHDLHEITASLNLKMYSLNK